MVEDVGGFRCGVGAVRLRSHRPPTCRDIRCRRPSRNTARVHRRSTRGWYLRGDLGAHWGLLSGAESAAPFPDPTDNSLGNGMTAGLGVGIKSNWLRTDVTIDYASPVKYQGTVAAAGDTTAKIQATTALFNGYLDLGTWYRITPYIGAGAGVAYARVSDYASTAAPPFSGDTSKNQWNFAWAGMAGVAYRHLAQYHGRCRLPLPQYRRRHDRQRRVRRR